MVDVEFCVLGPLEVVRDGAAVDVGGPRQRAVLAALLVERGRVVHVDRLADRVWDGSPPASAATTLRAYISNLRKALRPADVLHTRPQGYVLDVAADRIDAEVFAASIDDGREAFAAGDHRRAARELSGALALWRGSAYEDVSDATFAQAEAARLEELRLGCIEDLVHARIALGEHSHLTAELEALTADHPLRERLWAARMLALYRSGRQGDALIAYEEARRVASDELGADPSPELRRLHESILRHDETLAAAWPSSRSGKQTLSFVFTDVELSTEMLIRAEDEYEYAKVIDAHREALRDAFASRGGQRIRVWGDAFFAAFDTATDAVQAAVAAQLALQDEVRVRMGVHSGEVAVVDDDYVGLAVHAAARVQAAAHGGQILLTQATRELLDTDVSLLDLGLHRLKDIPEMVRLFQVVHPQLARTFPAPRTLSAIPHNLPPALTTFVGRQRESEQVAAALRESRLVTLTGVGGVGKTRLAREVATELLPEFPDGVWLVELAAIARGDDIVHAIGHASGVDQLPGMSMRESVVSELGQRRALVVLDNCEHLLAQAADLAAEVVASCPTARLLATSREGLGVEGERLYPLRSLGVPTEDDARADAVRLFEDRARTVRPDFELGPHNAAAVGRICRRLDGIPLAIELAAARVTAMGPLEIDARLDKGFGFLRSGRRAAVERHRTLQAVVDWSYALLSDEERDVFERLSVFAGGFTLEAAEAICDCEFDVADALAGLVTKSMVVADVSTGETRYSLLETLRQYGEDRLEARGLAASMRKAHAEHFAEYLADVSERAWQGDDVRAMRRIVREMDNVRAAVTWARETLDLDVAFQLLVPFHELGLNFTQMEMFDWALAVCELPGARGHPSFGFVAGLVGLGAWAMGNHELSREYIETAGAALPDVGDERRLPYLLAVLAYDMVEGRDERLATYLDEAIEIARRRGYASERSMWLSRTSVCETYFRDPNAGLEIAEEAHRLALSSGHSAATGLALYAIAEAIREQKDKAPESDVDLDRALAAIDESMTIAREGNHSFLVGIGVVTYASLKARYGDPVDALHSFGEVIEDWRRAAVWTQLWTTLRNLVELFGRIGADEAAVALLAAADASPSAPPVFGEHGKRLDALVDLIKGRTSKARYDAARVRGSAMTEEDAVRFAAEKIREALEQTVLETTS